MRLDSDFMGDIAMRFWLVSAVPRVALVVAEIFSQSNAVLDHWEEEGSDGDLKGDTTEE